MSSLNFPWCSLRLYLGAGTDPHLTTPSFQEVGESDKVSQSLLFSRLNNPSSLSLLVGFVLQTLHQPCCSCLDAFENLSVLPKLGGPEQDTALKVGSNLAKYRGTIPALVLLATLLLIQARVPMAFLATWAHCCVMFSLTSVREPRSSSAWQLSSSSSPSLQHCRGLLWPKCSTWHLVLLKLTALDSIKVVGNGFTNELGKCRGGGGKYASVAVVIKHKQAASVGLLRVSQQLPGQSLCWLVIHLMIPDPAEELYSLQQILWEQAPSICVRQNMEHSLEASHCSSMSLALELIFLINNKKLISRGETAGKEPRKCLTTFSRGKESKASLYWLSNDYYSFMFIIHSCLF